MILVGLWASLVFSLPAQGSARLESRINQLEFDLRRVRAQLSQLEAQAGRATSPRAPIGSLPAGTGDLPPETQLDNLAILAIETKRDLQRLEQRVDALESMTADRPPG
ncbi:hypothetical protein C7271_20110 [filamentous cyanobacterium CCP5]|nr:hypothetical protein C7271_20110 [filamentous cyanobacterium CCP5]